MLTLFFSSSFPTPHTDKKIFLNQIFHKRQEGFYFQDFGIFKSRLPWDGFLALRAVCPFSGFRCSKKKKKDQSYLGHAEPSRHLGPSEAVQNAGSRLRPSREAFRLECACFLGTSSSSFSLKKRIYIPNDTSFMISDPTLPK